MGSTLLERASRFRAALHENGLNTLQSESQIIPVVVGENEKVMRIAQRLREQDILVGAIRPPTVPEGTARLRISLSLAHSDADIDCAISHHASGACMKRLLIISGWAHSTHAIEPIGKRFAHQYKVELLREQKRCSALVYPKQMPYSQAPWVACSLLNDSLSCEIDPSIRHRMLCKKRIIHTVQPNAFWIV